MRGMSADGLQQARTAMTGAGVHPRAIEVFTHYYRMLECGESGLIAEEDLQPIPSLPRLDDLHTDAEAARDALAETVVIKLNGGLTAIRDGLGAIDNNLGGVITAVSAQGAK